MYDDFDMYAEMHLWPECEGDTQGYDDRGLDRDRYDEEIDEDETPEQAPDAPLIREDIAAINEWLQRGTW